MNKELKDIMEIIANENKELKGKVAAWKLSKKPQSTRKKKGDAQTTW